jgi:hypothetical protein
MSMKLEKYETRVPFALCLCVLRYRYKDLPFEYKFLKIHSEIYRRKVKYMQVCLSPKALQLLLSSLGLSIQNT